MNTTYDYGARRPPGVNPKVRATKAQYHIDLAPPLQGKVSVLHRNKHRLLEKLYDYLWSDEAQRELLHAARTTNMQYNKHGMSTHHVPGRVYWNYQLNGVLVMEGDASCSC